MPQNYTPASRMVFLPKTRNFLASILVHCSIWLARIALVVAATKPGEYDGSDDFGRSIDDCYKAVRERKADGGKGWPE